MDRKLYYAHSSDSVDLIEEQFVCGESEQETDSIDVMEERTERRQTAARRPGVLEYKRKVPKIAKASLEAKSGGENSRRPRKEVKKHRTVCLQLFIRWECNLYVRELTCFLVFSKGSM